MSNEEVEMELEVEAEMDMLSKVCLRIEEQKAANLQDHSEFVAIKSVSRQPKYQPRLRLAFQQIIVKLNSLGFVVREFKEEISKHTVLFAQLPEEQPEEKTLLIYGHVDVLPAKKNDGWLYEPFRLMAHGQWVYGRGIATGKGQLYCWLHAIEAWLLETPRLPVNVRFLIEAMYERDSCGLNAHLAHNQEFFKDIDYLALFTNSWLNETQSLVHSQVAGWLRYELQVRRVGEPDSTGCNFGRGLCYDGEALCDLCQLLATLTDRRSTRINIPNIERDTRCVTNRDWSLLEAVECDMAKLKEELELTRLPHERHKMDMLQHRWCKPSLSIHSVSSSSGGSPFHPVVPDRASCEFSLKLVHGQDLSYVRQLVEDHLMTSFDKIYTANQLTITVTAQQAPFCYDNKEPHIAAIHRSLERVFRTTPGQPHAICTDIPIVHLLRNYCDAPIMLVPFAKVNFQHLQPNEHLPIERIAENTKLAALLLYEVGQLPKRVPNAEG